MGRFQGNACPHHPSTPAFSSGSRPMDAVIATASKVFSEAWTREIWARAAAPALPPVEVVNGRRMVSAATAHHADYVGEDRWVVDWLPGRQFTAQAAKTAMYIASAPTWPEVERWAAVLGLTTTEARLFVAEAAR